ncbi:hypothetical protein R1flu_013116 [Riccia fluitans]|uniref:Uncharacterized protein n=1 Tax=Riccia fluitans TaxID=41844 RepID=A0ABD1ZF01_9MARC
MQAKETTGRIHGALCSIPPTKGSQSTSTLDVLRGPSDGGEIGSHPEFLRVPNVRCHGPASIELGWSGFYPDGLVACALGVRAGWNVGCTRAVGVPAREVRQCDPRLEELCNCGGGFLLGKSDSLTKGAVIGVFHDGELFSLRFDHSAPRRFATFVCAVRRFSFFLPRFDLHFALFGAARSAFQCGVILQLALSPLAWVALLRRHSPVWVDVAHLPPCHASISLP